jgi:hypothetical protein
LVCRGAEGSLTHVLSMSHRVVSLDASVLVYLCAQDEPAKAMV